jgi:hypothetical protein
MANLKLMAAAITAASIVLTGCVNQPKPGSPESAALIQEKKNERATEALEKRINEAPDWYLEHPKADLAIYGVGDSLHSDLSTARRSATLKARADIAGQLETYIAAQAKSFADGDTLDATGNSDIYDEVVKSTVKEVRISGASIKETKFVAANGKVQAYVLVEFPTGEANQALVNQIKKDATLTQRARRSEAFKELEKEVERMRKN